MQWITFKDFVYDPTNVKTIIVPEKVCLFTERFMMHVTYLNGLHLKMLLKAKPVKCDMWHDLDPLVNMVSEWEWDGK